MKGEVFYQLTASGCDIAALRKFDFQSSTIFTTKKLAEKRIPNFKAQLCDSSRLIALDPATIKIDIEALEVVE